MDWPSRFFIQRSAQIKPMAPPGAKAHQRALDKRDVQVGAVINRGVAAAVLSQEDGRDQLLAHIGRIADHQVERAGQVHQQEITKQKPFIGDRCRRAATDTVANQAGHHRRVRAGEGVAMQLNGSTARMQGPKVASASPGRPVAFHEVSSRSIAGRRKSPSPKEGSSRRFCMRG